MPDSIMTWDVVQVVGVECHERQEECAKTKKAQAKMGIRAAFQSRTKGENEKQFEGEEKSVFAGLIGRVGKEKVGWIVQPGQCPDSAPGGEYGQEPDQPVLTPGLPAGQGDDENAKNGE